MAIPGGSGSTPAAPAAPPAAAPSMSEFNGNPQTFVNLMAPYAEAAQQATGINAEVILAQWGNETAWGTSHAFQTNFNPAGIGITGSGVAGDDYGSIQAGVQAYINFVNDNPRYQIVKNAGVNNPQAQAIAFGNSGWAAGKYDDGGGPGSSLIADMRDFSAPSGVTAASLGPSVDPGLASYLSTLDPATRAQVEGYLGSVTSAKQATAGTAPNASQTAAASAANSPNLATGSTTIGGVAYTGTNQQTSALSTIEANLNTYGFTPAQVSQLTNWAWGEITNNVDPAQIAIDLQSQPAFLQAFPGFAAANTQLNAQGLPAVSVQQYQQYQTQAQAMAQAAGLPAGFINSQNIGTLIGGNVSTSELSARLNNAVTLAINSTPEQQQMFNEYFGTTYGQSGQGSLTPGQIAAIALDPTVAEPLIAQQITAAQIGGASVTSGVGALTAATATQLAQAGISEAQATSAFQSLAPYSALETPRPGMGGEAAQGTVSADQLATGTLLGNPAAERQLQQAQEVAKAPFTGGGGYSATNRGAGVGSVNPSGAPGQG